MSFRPRLSHIKNEGEMIGEKTGVSFPGNVCIILFDWKNGAIRSIKSLDIVALIGEESIGLFARFAALYHG